MVIKIKKIIFLTIFISGFFCYKNQLFPAALKDNGNITIVTTTSLISAIIEAIAQDKIEVVTIVPEYACPGHFDITPASVEALAQADFFIAQGLKGEFIVDRMFELNKNNSSKKIILDVEGNWMLPDVHIKASDRILEFLCRIKPQFEEFFISNALRYKNDIKESVRKIKKEAANINIGKYKVVSAQMQKDFLTWLGCKVAASYPRAEDISLSKLRDVIDISRKEGIVLVVDNLQSGATVGVPISEELKIPHIAIVGFPQHFNGELSYPETLTENAFKIINSLPKENVSSY